MEASQLAASFADTPREVATGHAAGRPFSLRCGAKLALEPRVLSMSGREAVSRCYPFDITVAVAATDHDMFRAGALRGPAELTIHSGGVRRVAGGIVRALSWQASLLRQFQRYRLRVVPRLWLLKKRRNSRVFQDLSVPQLVDALLAVTRVDAVHSLQVGLDCRRLSDLEVQVEEAHYATHLKRLKMGRRSTYERKGLVYKRDYRAAMPRRARGGLGRGPASVRNRQ